MMMIRMLMMLMMMMEMMMVRQMMIMMRLPMLIMLMITMRMMMMMMMMRWIDSPFVAQLTPTPLPVADWRVTHRALKCSSDWPTRSSAWPYS